MSMPAQDDQEQPPRFVRHAQQRQQHMTHFGPLPALDEPKDYAVAAQRWVWPAFAWLIGIFNLCVMIIALGNMWSGKYDAYSHMTALGLAVMSFMALAATYRFLLATVPQDVLPALKVEVQS